MRLSANSQRIKKEANCVRPENLKYDFNKFAFKRRKDRGLQYPLLRLRL